MGRLIAAADMSDAAMSTSNAASDMPFAASDTLFDAHDTPFATTSTLFTASGGPIAATDTLRLSPAPLFPATDTTCQAKSLHVAAHDILVVANCGDFAAFNPPSTASRRAFTASSTLSLTCAAARLPLDTPHARREGANTATDTLQNRWDRDVAAFGRAILSSREPFTST